MVRLVVALASEARPLIARYGLKLTPEARGFRVFLGDQMALIVSGIGRVAVAAATAYLEAFLAEDGDQPWVNVGIGGHAHQALGEIFLAHKIIDAGSGRCWYPSLVIDPPCGTAAVMTVDASENGYPDGAIYEMEAAGFFPTACRFSTSELVHAIKIISDNRASPTSQLTPAQVETLIESRLPVIDAVIEQSAALAQEIVNWERGLAHLQAVLTRWHFTVSERHRLRELLQHYQVLYPDAVDWPETLRVKRGGDVLRWLEARIAACPVRIA